MPRQKVDDLLARFIDIVVEMERRCPWLKRHPEAKTRSLPADIVDRLRKLADESDGLLVEIKAKIGDFT